MKTVKSITNDVGEVTEMQNLIRVYEEMAANKMHAVREGILAVREFYEELGDLSQEVGSEFEHISLPQTQLPVVVFIAANTGLYGNIVGNTFRMFMDFVKNNPAEIIVIGRVGEQMIKQAGLNISYKLLVVADDRINEAEINRLIRQILSYRKVILFYGKFRNIAIQNPTMTTIPGEILPKKFVSDAILRKIHFHYLYEPSLFHVTDLFANEIFSSIIEQAIHESQLAKFGSRLMHLDQAIDNITDELKSLQAKKRRLIKIRNNKKQNSMVTSIMVRGI